MKARVIMSLFIFQVAQHKKNCAGTLYLLQDRDSNNIPNSRCLVLGIIQLRVVYLA